MPAVQTSAPFALRRTMPARWARLGALNISVEREDWREVAEFTFIQDLAPGGCVVCVINGECISRRDWWQPVRDGDHIVFVQRMHGGGDSNPLRTILQLAVIVAAAYFGGPLGAQLGTSAAVGSAVITIGGTLLVNALLPPPTLAGGFGAPAAGSPTYSVQLAGNQARLGQSIPVRYGQEFGYPDFASQPYSEFADDDQFYCAVLCVGLGHHNILSIQLDDTDIRSFQDVQVAVVGPGQTGRTSAFDTYDLLADQTIVADNMVTAPEVAGQELIESDWIGAFAPVRAGLQMDTLWIDLEFPGLGTVQADGDVDSRSISWQVGVRAVNDFNQPSGAWISLATETLSAATTQAVRRSYRYGLVYDALDPAAVAPGAGRYQVRLRRVSARSDNRLHLNDMRWVGLRAELDRPGITRDDCTYVVLRARASEQLSGLTQRRVGVMWQRLIPVYDAGTETWGDPEFTRNPAHVAADILHDSTYGRGLPDSRIDLVTLDELAEVYAERQDRCDHSFDTRVTVDDALRLVARTGRAVPVLRRGAVYTLVRDEQQALPVAVFMPRNMQKDSFSIDYVMPTEETPDAVLLRYRDGQVWDERVVYAQVHDGVLYSYPADSAGTPLRPSGVPAPERVQEERLAGVIGQKHALREVTFLVADAYYRRTFASWMTELEGLLPAYGSLVSLGHDVASWGQSGDVQDWDAGTLTLTASEPLDWSAGGTHYVRLSTTAGAVTAAVLVTQGASSREMVLDSAPDETPVFDDATRERTRYLFGELADVTRYARIKGIAPQSQRDIRLSAVMEDDRVHTADNAYLPAPGETQDVLSDGTGVDPGAGGGGDLLPVYLANFTARSFLPLGRSDARFSNDGNAVTVANSGATQDLANQWLPLAPVTSAVAAEYEIRATLLTDPLDLGTGVLSGTFDAWLSLGTTREWGFDSAGDNVANPQMRFEIRDTVSQTLQASCVGTFTI